MIYLACLSRLIYSINMIITISGLPGSGKSTIGKMLAQKLGYKFYSMGDLRGKMAMDRGLTIDELNALGEKEDWTDRQADEYQEKLGKAEDNFIVDGRISFHFIPHSFKVFLDVDLKEAAKRVFANQRPDEAQAKNVEELASRMRARADQDDLRYKKYYGITFRDKKAFDLVIDTTDLTPAEILDRIWQALPKSNPNP